MKKILLIMLCFILHGQSQIVFAAEAKNYKCVNFGTIEEKVCRVSMYEIIFAPEQYDGKLIQITGFFSDGAAPLIFLGQDAYMTSRTVESLLVRVEDEVIRKALSQLSRSHILILGRFRSKDHFLSGVSGESISGSIDVKEASRAPGPWGYTEPMPSLLIPKEEKKER